MKQIKIILLLSFFVVVACSCSRGTQMMGHSGFTAQGVETWLDLKMTAAPTADLTGKWDAGSAFSGGWGEGNFVQEKAVFTGSLGLYYIKGVVSGSDVYFALLSNGAVYYTGVMAQKRPDSFFGKAVKDTFADSEAAKMAETYPISLKKMN
jgi:hypothetical protein